MKQTSSVGQMSQSELVAAIQLNTCNEKRATATFLQYGAEAYRRKLHCEVAKPSLFAWFTESFGMGETTACRRIAIIRAMNKAPEAHDVILEAIGQGRLSVDGMALVAPHITSENAQRLIQETEGKSRKAIEYLLAMRFPGKAKKKKKDRIRPVVIEPTEQPAPRENRFAPAGTPAESMQEFWEENNREPLHDSGATIGLEIRITLEGREVEDLRKLQELMPGINARDIIAAALRHYRNKKDLSTVGLGKKNENPPGDASPSQKKSRSHIPKSIRAEVYQRDGGQCTFVSDDGKRCSERGHLEFDHIIPFAMGGDSTAENLRLLCRSHNSFAADRAFGEDFMRAKKGMSWRKRISKAWFD